MGKLLNSYNLTICIICIAVRTRGHNLYILRGLLRDFFETEIFKERLSHGFGNDHMIPNIISCIVFDYYKKNCIQG